MKRKRSDKVQLKVRLKEPLRAKIEAAAKRSGVSLNAETVQRLEQTFRREDAREAVREAIYVAFGGPEGFNLALKIAAARQTAENIVGAPIAKNDEAFHVAVRLIFQVLTEAGPKPKKGTLAEALAGSWQALKTDLERGQEEMNRRFDEALSRGEAA